MEFQFIQLLLGKLRKYQLLTKTKCSQSYIPYYYGQLGIKETGVLLLMVLRDQEIWNEPVNTAATTRSNCSIPRYIGVNVMKKMGRDEHQQLKLLS